jgi:hypothetical protein
MMIFVKTLPVNIIRLDVKPSNTIDKIKTKLQDQEGFPPRQQHLFFGRQLLESGHTLSYYNIEKETTLCLLLHFHGGARIV